MLKKIEKNISLITNEEIYKFIKKSLRGGICTIGSER